MGKFRACGILFAAMMLVSCSLAYAEEAKAAPNEAAPALKACPSMGEGAACPMAGKQAGDAALLCPLGNDCQGPCDACPMSNTGGKSPGEWLSGMKEKLGLDDKQVDKLKKLGAEFDERVAERKATIKMKLGELKAMMEKGANDAQALKAKLLEITSDKIETVVSFVESKQKALAELAADQKQKLEKLLDTQKRDPADPAKVKATEIP